MNICRLCADKKSLDELVISLQDTVDKIDLKITYKIYVEYCCQLTLNSNPELPQRVCRSCKKFIEEYEIFSNNVEKNQKHLIEQLNNSQRLKKKPVAENQKPKDSSANCLVDVKKEKETNSLTREIKKLKTGEEKSNNDKNEPVAGTKSRNLKRNQNKQQEEPAPTSSKEKKRQCSVPVEVFRNCEKEPEVVKELVKDATTRKMSQRRKSVYVEAADAAILKVSTRLEIY